MTGHEQYVVIKDLARLKDWSASRVDLCADDFEKAVTPKMARLQANKGNFSGFKRHGWVEQWLSGKTLGATHSFGMRGSKGSGKYLRIYDKWLESDGEIDSVRWELELSGKMAKTAFAYLAGCDNPEDYVGKIAKYIGGSISFVHRTGEKNLERLKVVGWWAKIVRELGSAKLTVKRTKPGLEKSKEWFEHAVSKKLSMLAEYITEVYGKGSFQKWINNSMSEGYKRITPKEHELITRTVSRMNRKSLKAVA
jgi:DNA relaxase NicK